MLSDHLSRAHLYRLVHPRITRALDYLQQTDVATLTDGTYAIEGDEIFAIVQRYVTKPLAQGRWEQHRRYIDLQLVVEGTERIGYAPASRLQAEPYDAARDLQWLDGHGDFLTLAAGEFVVLWPDDAHMPGIAVAAPAAVTKVVVKIASA
jgi:YhcH/YjgK/YiaL family protein